MTLHDSIKAHADQADKLAASYRRLIKKAAEDYGSTRSLSRALGKSHSYIMNLIRQDQGITALRKAAERIGALSIQKAET